MLCFKVLRADIFIYQLSKKHLRLGKKPHIDFSLDTFTHEPVTNNQEMPNSQCKENKFPGNFTE